MASEELRKAAARGDRRTGARRLRRVSAAAHADSLEMAGKKVIFVPIAMGISLTEGWARG